MKSFFKNLIIILLGFLVGVFSVYFYEAYNHVNRIPHITGYKKTMPTMPIEINPTWIKSGRPIIKSVEFSTSTSFNSFSGIFEVVGPTVFDWTFSLDESLYLLSGEVQIEYHGKLYNLTAGDTAFFHRGTKATFHVPNDFKKAWTCYRSGTIANWLVNLKHQKLAFY